MRVRTTVTVFVLALCPVEAGAGSPQPEGVMTISGISGSMTVRVDQTDWAQIEGLPDPRTPELSSLGNPMISRPGSPLTSRGGTSEGGSGRVGMQDFVIVKDLDKASPKLDNVCASGTHIPEVRLEITNAGGRRGLLVIKMRNVVITRVDRQPSIEGNPPTQAVTFTCKSIEWESQPASTPWRVTPVPYTLTPRPR